MTLSHPNKKPIRLKISRGLEKKIRNGHPWIFDYQITNQTDSREPPGLGVVYDSSNHFLALGLYDPESAIRLRVLQTGKPSTIDQNFFHQRLEKAWAAREFLESDSTNGFRIINGENDGFPALVLDRYADTLVMKIYSSAWIPFLRELCDIFKFGDKFKRCVIRLSRNFSDKTICDGDLLFGPQIKGPLIFNENGLVFNADVMNGQKTGFYFDQRENRERIRDMARDQSVLNAFSYTGAFSVYAMAGGCKSVLEIDSNPHALKMARSNIKLNFPRWADEEKKIDQIQGDAFKKLSQLADSNRKFDLVILDPPALASGKTHKTQALKAYAKLAREGARMVAVGGNLFSASCSRPIQLNEFSKAVEQGIASARRNGHETFRSDHAIDHPVTFSGGGYLKAVFWKF